MLTPYLAVLTSRAYVPLPSKIKGDNFWEEVLQHTAAEKLAGQTAGNNISLAYSYHFTPASIINLSRCENASNLTDVFALFVETCCPIRYSTSL
jgi:hypothetical protein